MPETLKDLYDAWQRAKRICLPMGTSGWSEMKGIEAEYRRRFIDRGLVENDPSLTPIARAENEELTRQHKSIELMQQLDRAGLLPEDPELEALEDGDEDDLDLDDEDDVDGGDGNLIH